MWRSDEIDVYVISGEADDARPQAMHMLEQHSDWPAYGWGLAIVVLCTLLAWLVFPFFGEANLIMIYLLGIVARCQTFWTWTIHISLGAECLRL